MKFNILPIGDLHGKSEWKDVIREASELYDIHMIVFLGDYVDSFTHTADEQIKNLRELIKFKQKNKDNVELLIGNHDIQYFLPLSKLNMVKCSGYQDVRYFDYHTIFRSYKNYFKLAYQFKNYLFTHAGIHKGWYAQRFKSFHENGTLAEALNREFEVENEVLWDCGFQRGGSFRSGGPLWADFIETYKKPIVGYHQIVGHTRVKNIKTYSMGTDTSVSYYDALDLENNFKIISIDTTDLWQKKIAKENLSLV